MEWECTPWVIRITVANRDYRKVSQPEIACDKRISQHLSSYSRSFIGSTIHLLGVYVRMAERRIGTVAVRTVLVLNAVVWLFVWAMFAYEGRPYVEHRPVWEERKPNVVVFHHALSPERESEFLPFTAVVVANLPSFAVLRYPAVWAVNHQPELWDRLFVGTSVHGYMLIGTMVLSFFQWYWVTKLVATLVERFRDTAN
jgi:hypothetical protein